jgi:SdrD B-like domain/HYR domain
MKKQIQLIFLVFNFYTAFTQGSIINGKIINNPTAANGLNGTGTIPITLYAHLVHEKNGNPNDLEVINSTQVGTDGIYNINSPQHNLSVPGLYKVYINQYAGTPYNPPYLPTPLPNTWLTNSLPIGWINISDYAGNGDSIIDGISGNFSLGVPLNNCPDPMDPNCEGGGPLRKSAALAQVDFVNFAIKQIVNSVTLTSNSPICVGQTLVITPTVSPNPYPNISTITGPNGQIFSGTTLSNTAISNVTALDGGTYTLSGTYPDGSPFIASTLVTINTAPPTIAFTSGATNLSLNAPNTTYATDAPNNYTVNYTLAPINAGTISNAGMVDWENTYTGQATITASISNTCGTKTISRVIQITPPLFTPATLSSNSPVCEGGTLTLIVQNENDAPYSIIGPNGQPVTNLTINNVTPSSAGIYTINSGDGLINIGLETTSVVINPLPPTITFNVGPLNLPQNPPNETFLTNAPNTFTVNYTISPSVAGTINNAGTVNWDDLFTGQATITASITNACGTKTATKTIDIIAPTPTYNIGDIVFNDQNKNGAQDVGEPGIPNLTVNLYQADGLTMITSTTTDAQGNYIFQILEAGDYVVGVVPNTQYPVSSSTTVIADDNGLGNGLDNGTQPFAGAEAKSPVINLNASDGIGDLTVDFGFHALTPLNAPASISSNSPICVGQTLVLTVINPEGSVVDYTITGPNGAVTNLNITNATAADAGSYTISSFNNSDGSPLGDQMITVVVNPILPNLNIISGATTLIQNAANQTYATNAPIGRPVTYSLVPSNAGSISALGVADWNSTFYGQVYVKASITNPCGTKKDSVLVTISQDLPTIICTDNILIPLASGVTDSQVVSFNLPIVADATVTQITGPISGSLFPFGNTVITFQATNALGNTSNCSFTIAIYSVTAPLVTDAEIPNVTPNSNGDFSIPPSTFLVTVPLGEVVDGLFISEFPAGAESIVLNGITYGPPLAIPLSQTRNVKVKAPKALTPFPPTGVTVTTNDAGVPDTPIVINPAPGSSIVAIEYFAVNSNGITSPLPATVTITFTSAPLPINLISFIGKKLDHEIELNWKTSNESNFSHFEVERSINAKAFDKIGEVNGNGAENYQFFDNSILNFNPLRYYYRLKMVDLNGRSNYSKTISISIENTQSYFLVENPATANHFFVKSNIKNPNFILLNSLGQKSDIEFVKIQENEYKLKTKNITTGICFLMLQSEGNVVTRKLLLE